MNVTVTLPMGVWLGVEDALVEQRNKHQQLLDRKSPLSKSVSEYTQNRVDELTHAIHKIRDATASVGD